METKLIQREDYLFFLDLETQINKGDFVYDIPKEIFFKVKDFGENGGKTLIEDTLDFSTPYEVSVSDCKKILGYYTLTKESKELDLPLLPPPTSNDSYIQNRAKIRWGNVHRTGVLGFIEGYKEAQKDSFSLEDMKKCYEGVLQNVGTCVKKEDLPTFEEYIENLPEKKHTIQIPKEFHPKYDDTMSMLDISDDYSFDPVIKSFKNKEGKTQLEGTYKY